LFTGIIVELGTVVSLNRRGNDARLAVSGGSLSKDAAVGDSICINGVCLTVVKINGDTLSFDLSDETLRSTNLGGLGPVDRVNLEPSLRADGKLGGHFVTGHVDAVGKIKEKSLVGDAFRVVIDSPEQVTGLLVDKGSVAIDGISLTVVGVSADAFSVVIIPHTARVTTIGLKGVGDSVNIEADIIGKYVARFIKGASLKGSGDDRLLKSLQQSGFLREV
jgi:riboflavin synthase